MLPAPLTNCRNVKIPFLWLIQKLTTKFTKNKEETRRFISLYGDPVIPANAGIQKIRMTIQTATFWIATSLTLLAMTSGVAMAAINIPFTINLSENVTVTGTPRIAVDVGGNIRYAAYTSGTGTNALTFTLSPTIGDVDLDGITVSSPIDLNGGTIKDTAGNDATLTFTPPNTTGIKVNYPSLGIDFTNGTSGRYTLNGTVYNSFSSFLTASGGTFARSSIATYFDSTGTLQTASANTPRFDYDPVTHAAKGILIEEQRINRLLNSSNFNGAGWNRTDLTVDNIGPHIWGLQKVTEGTAGTASLRQNVIGAFTAGADVTGSFFVAKGTTDWIVVKMNDGGGGEVANFWFNLTTGSLGTVTKTGGNNEARTITQVSANVYRVTVTFLPNAASLNRGLIISSASANGSLTPVASAEYYVSYAQLEQGRFPTSYIPTTSVAVTRAMDTLNIPTGSWYNASQGTMSVRVDDSRPAGLGIWASLGTPGTAGNRL